MVNIQSVIVVSSDDTKVYGCFDNFWQSYLSELPEDIKQQRIKLKQSLDRGTMYIASLFKEPTANMENICFIFGSVGKAVEELSNSRTREVLCDPNSIITVQLKKTTADRNAIVAIAHGRNSHQVFITRIEPTLPIISLFTT